MNRVARDPLEIWGGVECSHVRLSRGVENQLARTGHDRREDDIDRLAALGLRTLRYPVLWEHHATASIDWRWADARLGRLRELGIRPIVGLLHHGAGPLAGGLLDPEFVSGLARFAGAVAARYPWVDAYTPVNEPLTTARFSGMYGIWHPFHRDHASFVRMFVQQCHAVRAAMRAIRAVNPAARLIQTEDIGKTHSTDALAYQAEFENERRWLTFDLLGGRLTAERPLYHHLLAAGIGRDELESFISDPCLPDILGMNHYVTSERFLDERLENYPPGYHGGNGRQAYADVPAVRVRVEGAAGPARLLGELWQRYHRPIAITEVQLACTRDEQLRWLQEIWSAAQQVRAGGADIRAVTAWALFGAYDWDSLLLRQAGYYEVGAFDVRSGVPRETAVAKAIRSLARTGRFHHPAARGPGWWRRPLRYTFPPVSAPHDGPGTAVVDSPQPRPPLLVVGANAEAAATYAGACEMRGLAFKLATEPTLTEAASATPWGVITALNPPPRGPDSPRTLASVHAHIDQLIDAITEP